MKNHRICYGVLCLISLFTYIIANNYISLAFFAVLMIFPIASFATQKFAIQSFSLDIQTKTSCYVNQELPIKIEIQKKNSILAGPVFVHLVFENILYGSNYKQTIILQPSEKKNMQFTYPLHMKDCGNTKISVESVNCMDLLGLFQTKYHVSKVLEVLVYPVQIQLNTLLQRKPETITDGELYDYAKHGQDVNEVSGLRDYTEGDTPRSIHWKLSSKLDNLVVREFGYPSNYNTLILYQMAKTVNGVTISNNLNNAVLSLCASLSYSVLEKNLEHQVGCMFQGELHSNPVTSLATYDQMVLNLLCSPIEDNTHSNDMVYQILHGNLTAEYTKIIYITPEYDESSIRQLARSVDLTIIQLVEGKLPEYINANGYSVTSINIDDYEEKTHNISI